MSDEPVAAAKAKPNSSMHVGGQLVKDGEADAFVSAGNTGALLVVATLYTLKRIRSVKRPAIAPVVPLPTGPLVVLDMGASVDCKPEFIAQYGLMGSVFAEKVLGIENPRVALLNIAEENDKGNELTKQSNNLLADSALNFMGSAEPKELLKGYADVAVGDGFTVDIFIKAIEATVAMLTDAIRGEIRAGVVTSLGGLLARPAFKRVAQQLNPTEVGGGGFAGTGWGAHQGARALQRAGHYECYPPGAVGGGE